MGLPSGTSGQVPNRSKTVSGRRIDADPPDGSKPRRKHSVVEAHTICDRPQWQAQILTSRAYAHMHRITSVPGSQLRPIISSAFMCPGSWPRSRSSGVAGALAAFPGARLPSRANHPARGRGVDSVCRPPRWESQLRWSASHGPTTASQHGFKAAGQVPHAATTTGYMGLPTTPQPLRRSQNACGAWPCGWTPLEANARCTACSNQYILG
jgi:hypothetical protein